MIPSALLLIFFLINLHLQINHSLKYSLKDSKNFFMQSLPLYTSCLFSMLLNYGITYIEKLDGICSLTYVVNKFSGLLLHSLIFSIKHSRSA